MKMHTWLLLAAALGMACQSAPGSRTGEFALSGNQHFALRSIEAADDPTFSPNAQRAAALALVAGLEARGLVQVDEPWDADFMVTLGSSVETELELGSRASAAAGVNNDLEVRRFTVDFHDPNNDRRVWRGVGGAHFEARQIDEVRVADTIEGILTSLR